MLKQHFQNKLDEAFDLIQNNPLLALDIFDELLKTESDNIDVINGKGSALMKLNRMDEAEKCFNRSIGICENPSAFINKGIISKNRNDYLIALKYYDDAIKLDQNLNNLISILKNEINDLVDENILNLNNFTSQANDYIKRGIDYKNENKLWDALECFNQAISEDTSCESSILILIEEIKQVIYNQFLFNAPDIQDDDLKIRALRALYVHSLR